MTQFGYAVPMQGNEELERGQAGVFRSEVGNYDKFSRNGDAEDLRTVWHQLNGSFHAVREKTGRLEQETVGSVLE